MYFNISISYPTYTKLARTVSWHKISVATKKNCHITLVVPDICMERLNCLIWRYNLMFSCNIITYDAFTLICDPYIYTYDDKSNTCACFIITWDCIIILCGEIDIACGNFTFIWDTLIHTCACFIITWYWIIILCGGVNIACGNNSNTCYISIRSM